MAQDDRCKILVSSLQDTLHGIEAKSYGGLPRVRGKLHHRNEIFYFQLVISTFVFTGRSRSRDLNRHRAGGEGGERRRERSRSREYRDRSRERDRYYEYPRERSRSREYRDRPPREEG